MTFEELYNRLLKSSVSGNFEEELDLVKQQGYDPHHLSCLLGPEKHPVVIRTDACTCEKTKLEQCRARCYFDALFIEDGAIAIDPKLCVGCGECIRGCDAKKLTESRDILPALNALRNADAPVYAMIAPAFINQYSEAVTPGKLRAAFKKIGFAGMVEVALFADILTLKEALEFDKNIQTEKDYQLTSCCCPMWIAMIKKVYAQLIPHVPAAVSPMVACGRSIKKIHPNAVTVFIGPCVAKKAEAREADIADSTDFVLTFQEIQDVFDYAGINLAEMEEDDRDHSSRAGRIYAGTGGVSEAVRATVARIHPGKPITVKTRHADGVPACKQMLNDILEGKGDANFFEGMGCVGGCVGGPKALIPRDEGRKNVVRYGAEASYDTPIDNPYVIALLHQLGLDTIESLLEKSDIFVRKL
ncbi:MAG TPA: [Fe-Fe] hydrogenase large subunit C-terminal domain-containing protein [Clostridia bacterium]|nr:[Fe-Fe] hydrogenase large subunit C-terminal domain-containing protein [Clostridia bacterium]